jgi:hypothetical protein
VQFELGLIDSVKDEDMAIEKTNEKLNTEKKKALELAISQIEKRFGKGSG